MPEESRNCFIRADSVRSAVSWRVSRKDVEDHRSSGRLVTVGSILRGPMGLTRRQVSRVKFRDGGITVNGKPARVTGILAEGDIVCVDLSDPRSASERLIPARQVPHVLYEDPDLICVDKPAGIIVHPGGDHDADSLANQVSAWLEEKRSPARICPVGRLDRDVTGVVVFAKHRLAAARLWEQRRDGRFRKEYMAWCRGTFPADAGFSEQTVSVPVAHDPRNYLRMKVVPEDNPDGIPRDRIQDAVTHYQVVRQEEDRALIRLSLQTGRQHQIRLHMAYLGHPVCGDPVYGTEEIPGSGTDPGMMLCAVKAVLEQPVTGEMLVLRSELSKILLALSA